MAKGDEITITYVVADAGPATVALSASKIGRRVKMKAARRQSIDWLDLYEETRTAVATGNRISVRSDYVVMTSEKRRDPGSPKKVVRPRGPDA